MGENVKRLDDDIDPMRKLLRHEAEVRSCLGVHRALKSPSRPTIFLEISLFSRNLAIWHVWCVSFGDGQLRSVGHEIGHVRAALGKFIVSTPRD